MRLSLFRPLLFTLLASLSLSAQYVNYYAKAHRSVKMANQT